MNQGDSNSRCVLVIGGTGMLRPAVESPLRRGFTVLTVARRPQRPEFPADLGGEHVPVEGEWDRPEELVDHVRAVLDGRGAASPDLHGAILWVQSPYRRGVLDQLERLLSPETTVLQLWGSATQDPREVLVQEDHPTRPWMVRHLVLGYHRGPTESRWLTNEQISEATMRAWDGDGTDDGVCFTAGRIDPWECRP